ncbi:response regulator transcription factor [Rufibacter glacialis]|uniref:Response regulator transcription factor n=1 Tax=Rufibacter glacialis TaxID=1259555 RepID=A0A5M8QRW9_9BACT|nr:response regulator transcription factor [Rufibacter glacialis]KAA6437790.1 response regulator transcription factor [Rufibacter glacialis]GGK56221.1 transcriptional regulatory protein RprY [Rufibacter glacialis]
MAHILVVEDDPNLGFLLQDSLESAGYAVTLCPDGEAGLIALAQTPFDLCVLDVMLPKLDGFSLAQELRQRNATLPFMFLTAKTLKADRLQGFELGCDDYLTKPFGLEELVYRVKAILRRSAPTAAAVPSEPNHALPEIIAFGASQLDFRNLQLQVGGRTHTLTHREAELLRLFAQHPHQLLRREEILQRLWQDDGYFVGRSLDVFISRLRKYLQPDSTLKITTVHGRGYKLEVAE